MNIFVLDLYPRQSASALADVHVNKMIVESMQMLTTALHKTGILDADELPLRADGKTRYSGNAHPHHPCTIWLMEDIVLLDKWEIKSYPSYSVDDGSLTHIDTIHLELQSSNLLWFSEYLDALFDEYKRRFGKTHGSLLSREMLRLEIIPNGERPTYTDRKYKNPIRDVPNYFWREMYFSALNVGHTTGVYFHRHKRYELEVKNNFVQAMPDEFKVEGDPVKAYRQYYHTKPASMKKKKVEWLRGRPAPNWWMQGLADYIKAMSEDVWGE